MKITLKNEANLQDLQDFLEHLETYDTYLKSATLYLRLEDSNEDKIDVVDEDGRSAEIVIKKKNGKIDILWNCENPQIAKSTFSPQYSNSQIKKE